jgi:hypothetical protein
MLNRKLKSWATESMTKAGGEGNSGLPDMLVLLGQKGSSNISTYVQLHEYIQELVKVLEEDYVLGIEGFS